MMPAYRDKDSNKWYVQFRYVDWTGKRCQKMKRGFDTKKEAEQWERQFKIKEKADVDMRFSEFWKLYEADMKPRLKLNIILCLHCFTNRASGESGRAASGCVKSGDRSKNRPLSPQNKTGKAFRYSKISIE